jgi:quercetin dioxygenase-like cupin family protein/iron-sulfur cluster repair protein YtfE (RIC family)
VPLSHDHHHALVAARRLRQAAGGPPGSWPEAAAAFAAFLAAESTVHFREEEELVFPLLHGRDPEGLVERAVIDHAALRGLVRELTAAPEPALMREIADRLEAHVRLEERELFPAVEACAGDEALDALPLLAAQPPPSKAPEVRDCSHAGAGIHWGLASEDLNATLLELDPGGAQPESVNAQRDVLLVAIAGDGTLQVDGEPAAVQAPAAVLVPRGRRRRLTAGSAGLRFLSVHLRRPGIELRRGVGPRS